MNFPLRTRLPSRLAAALCVALLAAVALPGPAHGQDDGTTDALNAASAGNYVAPPDDELGRGSPQGTTRGFLEASRKRDYETAARYLDLTDVAPDEGKALARQLFVVLDRTLWVTIEEMSDSAVGHEQDVRNPGLEVLVGKAERDEEPPTFYLERVARGDGTRIWKFSANTLARVPRLYETYGDPKVLDLLPSVLLDGEFLEIGLWQWVALIILVVAAYLLAWIAAGLIVRLARPLVSRSKSNLDDRLLALTVPPLRLLATVALFQAGMPFLRLKVPAVRFFGGICTAAAVLGVTWLIFRVIDLFAGLLRERMRQRGQASAVYLVPLGARTLKIVIGVFTLLAALDNLGFDVTTIIAGLGVGGLAVALALRPTLENIFGGVTVLIDQPVRPGEFCRYGDKIGIVEEVGIRSTRIRSLDRTIVTVANSEFSSMQIENFAKRDRIRLITTLGLRYETSADQLRYVIAELRRLIESHVMVYAEPRRVRFVGFGSSSLDLEVLCYITTSDWSEFLAVREDIYLRMIDVVEQSGSGFAFPSTTIYRAEDDGLDQEKTRSAEAQIAAWREQGELMFPDFNDEERAAMRDSIAYPPEGSGTAGSSV